MAPKVAKALLFFVFGFTITLCPGQKLVRKVLVNPQTKAIQIDGGECYAIDISTTKAEEVLVKATIDGEYSNDLLVTIEEEGQNLFITAGFSPDFENPNDKLSAHKVVSISLNIELPEYMNTRLFATHTNVNVEGLYKKLRIDLADGNCTLNNAGEMVEVRSQSGNIVLRTAKGTIDAHSTYGRLFQAVVPEGDYSYKLRAIEGDIRIMKTE